MNPQRPAPAQISRKHVFHPENYAIVRLETPEAVIGLRDDLVAFYRPVNSQELFAVERIALSQLSLLRCAALESGFFITCLDEATERPGTPLILMNPEVTHGIDVTAGQNRSYWLAEGFNRLTGKSASFLLVIRYQAQTARLYRRAVEDFDRLKALRAESPTEPLRDPEPQAVEPDPPVPAGAAPQAAPSPEIPANPASPLTPAAALQQRNRMPSPWTGRRRRPGSHGHGHNALK